MIEMVFFSIFLIKEEQQQLLAQIIDALNSFINNPLFAEYGRIGLFVNGVFSTFIPFPPEVTAISLILAGISRIEILIILVTSWIIGAALGYYAGLYGKKLAAIFKGNRKEMEKPGEEDADDNNKGLSGYNQKIQDNPTNDGRRHNKKDENKQSRYRQLLERYGWAIIFVSPWIPILGDIIPVIAGAKRYEMKKFMLAIAAGKTARAVAVIFLGSYLASIPMPSWI
ncbi:MAG: VTT domain-containing protein [Thermoproteota archaeon]|nr:VTT domain-containing protein [Thermoproteota archaeon]